MKRLHNRFLRLPIVVFLGVFLGGTSGLQASWRSDWENTVAAAKKEGQVNVYVYSQVLEPAVFEKAFPGIKMSLVSGRGGAIAHRVMSERRAGKYLADISMEGVETNYWVFYKAKILEPIKPALILPEVVDQSRWFQGKHHYVDKEEKYIFEFLGIAQTGSPYYNTDLVKPEEIKSFWDLLNPKWKGKIGIRDLRASGHGAGNMRFLYHNPQLGEKFFRRLFGEMDMVVFRGFRQGTDWLAQGKLALCFGCADVENAKLQGLPVDELGILKEGAGLTTQAGTIALHNRAPHSNAAKVFINWFLSREGQIHSTEYVAKARSGAESLRIDIPNVIPPKKRRKEGVTYIHVGKPETSDMKPVIKFIEKVLAEDKPR